MKSFVLTQAQIARVAGAAAADELARRFNRHVDFLTSASWGGETPLGAGGLSLSTAERTACAERIASLFGLEPEFLSGLAATRIEDWARALADELHRSMTAFSFKPAARTLDDDAYRHRADEIFQDAAAAANILAGRRRLLSFVAPHSLLGFVLSILTPNLLGVESIDARGMTPDALSASLLYGDVLIATPTLWRYMVQEQVKAPDNTLAVSFGEPMTLELAAEMRQCGFGVLRELYGSTETGLIAWRDTPGEEFVLFDQWRRNDDDLLRVSPDGAARRVEPMDILGWKSDRSFSLSGRRDGAIQIGAVNVFPEAVAATIRAHALVSRCRISVGRRANGASRLIAHIVLEKGAAPSEKVARDIDAWCRESLRQQERPQIYNFEDA